MPAGTRVAGQVRLAPGPCPRAAAAWVRVEDVGRVDAASVPVAEQRVEVPAGAASFRFDLRVEHHEARGAYALSVHVDVDGDGQVGVGDFINVQRYPVLTGADGDAAAVEARRIEG
ncbi:MAG: YbaY family lipoprotein [Gemmatimonadetes bacterium]|nr:YbaY family lipoprotein [Gemmatimonadota bacterium]